MSDQLRFEVVGTILGVSYRNTDLVDADNVIQSKPVAPVSAAKTGTLTTRTDNDTGELTMAAGHGIVTGDRLDIYWTEAGVEKYRAGVTVGVVAGNAVPIDLGTGDNLPPATTAITASVPVSEPVVVTGNNVVAMGVTSDKKGLFVFTDAANAELHREYVSANGAGIWYSLSGVANPFAGDAVAKIFFSNGDSTGTANMRAAVGYN